MVILKHSANFLKSATYLKSAKDFSIRVLFSSQTSGLESNRTSQSMGRCVWVVRHGERIDNVDLDWANTAPRGAWDDPPITARGLKQAKETGIALAQDPDPIHHIFSSPMFRCLQTVNAIVTELKRASKGTANVPKIYVEPGFVESLNMCQSPPGYLPIEELVAQFPSIDPGYKPYLTPEKMPVENTGLACVGRVGRTLEHVIAKYSGNILVVSHGAPITSCHYALTHEMAYVGQCSISKYRSDSNGEKRTKVETTSVEPKSPPAEKVSSLKRQKTVEGDDKVDEKTGKAMALDPKPICGETMTPFKVTKKQTFKCVYVGSTDHLSEKENLREVIHLTEADQAIVDECLQSNFN